MLAEREIFLPNEEITEEVTGMLMMAETRYKHGLAEGRAEAHAEDRAAFVKSYVETVKSVRAATDWAIDKTLEIVIHDQQLANEVREALEKEQQDTLDEE